jgi:putative cell wall-binding protein
MGGSDRYQTSVLIAQKGWPNGSDNVILAYGGNYPDALAGNALAGALNAPILLTQTAAVPS